MKKIYLKLTFLFFISAIPVVSYNYFIDPYGILNNASLMQEYERGYEPNQHYSKIRHLIHDKHQWDSYLFGTSRVGRMNPDLIPDGQYYNLNYSEGVPGEFLADIRVLIKNSVPVKNVMIGLDSSSYKITPEDQKDKIVRHPYDESDIERALFQLKYLLSAPLINTRTVKGGLSINYNILGNGMHILDNVERNIEEDIEDHITSDRFRVTNKHVFDKASDRTSMKMMEDTLADIADIIKLTERHNIKLHLFITPMNVLFYYNDNPYDLLIFKKKLAQLTDYWDFSGYNSITTNNYYYYEMSHFRTIAGNLILCRMFNCRDLEVPEDFGVYVTKDNVGKHIREQENDLNEYIGRQNRADVRQIGK